MSHHSEYDEENELNLTFSWYNEDEDVSMLIALSDQIIKCVEDQGWIFKRKLGQGASTVAFLLSKNNQEQVLLINKHNHIEGLASIRKLQRLHKDAKNYIARVYKPLNCYGILSEDPVYLKVEIEHNYQFSMVEPADYTLAETLYRRLQDSVESKKHFIADLFDDIVYIFEYIEKIGYNYSDRQSDNFAYSNNFLILIDLESLRPGVDKISPIDIAYEIIGNVVIPPFEEDNFLILKNEDSWKGVTGFSRDNNEESQLGAYLEELMIEYNEA